MRGQTLETVLTRYREECGLSTNLRHNLQVRDAQVSLLARIQEWVYDEADWPHMRARFRVPIEAGLREYVLPANLNPDRIISAERVGADGARTPLIPLIGAAEENFPVSENGDDGRSDATTSYEVSGSVLRIWPTPRTTSGHVEIEGYKTLSRFLQDDDRCDIDDQLIYLYAAAETLTASGDRSATAKLEAANQRLQQLVQHHSKIKVFTNGGGVPAPRSGNFMLLGGSRWR